MKTLTPQILGMYLGCPFIFNETPNKEPYTLEGIIGDTVYSELADESGEGSYFIGDIKLILRRLSDMTEEEAVELMKINRDFMKTTSSEYLKFGSESIWAHVHQSAALATNYLRSIGIDCDNLLDSGLAVYNNQHPTK